MVALVKEPWTRKPTVERRLFPRQEVNLFAHARRLDHTLEAHQQPRLTLTVRDLSLSGLSALVDVPLNHGEHIGVSFPAQNTQRPWDAFGHVVRCEPSALGYRVAVEFDLLPAA
ncbi:MAG: PilZ domain-containing protein [Bacillota bacterium]